MKSIWFSRFGLLLVVLAMWPSSATSADPFAFWSSLSEQDRAEIQKTLTERLPAIMPEDAQEYAKTLAKEIPRWGALGGYLEAGEYAPMIGLYADDLSEYVDQRFDELLPDEGVARDAYALAKENPESLKKLLIALADPKRSWGDVGGVLWDDVKERADAHAQQWIKGLVRDVINEVAGEAQVGEYTAGDLYLLAIESWADAVRRFGDKVESAAANQLYRQYRLERGRTGSKESAEQHIRDLWETGYVPGPDGRRLPASWNARLARMGLTIDDYLLLFDRCWTSPEGQNDLFYGWFEETSRMKIRAAQARLANAANAKLEQAREQAQKELRAAHIAAARELRKAIEQRLTAPHKAARDEALRQAKTLLTQLEERNVGVAREAHRVFVAALRELESLDDQVRGNRATLNHLDSHIEWAKRLDELGAAREGLETAFANLVVALEAIDTNVAAAERAAAATCAAAAMISQAATQEQGRQLLHEAFQEAAATRAACAATEQSIDQSLRERKSLMARLQSLDAGKREVLHDAQEHLRMIEEALADFRQRQAVEVRWNELHARLHAAAGKIETILLAFEVKARRIEELLAPHHANAAVDDLRRAVDRLRGHADLVAIQQDWETWGRWNGRKFPGPLFAMPDAEALREARELVAAYTKLATLPDIAKLEAAARDHDQELTEIRHSLAAAQFRADVCSARAIVEFDRTWLKGDLTRAVREGAGGGGGTPTQPQPRPKPANLSSGLTDGKVAVDPPRPRPGLNDLGKGLRDGPRPPPGPMPTDPPPERTTGPTPRPPPPEPPPPVVVQPFYAVYGVHAYPAMPQQFGDLAEGKRQLQQIVERFAPAAQPGQFMAFRVSGELLEDYGKHQQAVQRGEAQGEFVLFRPGARYHQDIVATDNQGAQYNLPLFLSFIRLEAAEPGWVQGSSVFPLPELQGVAMTVLDMSGRGQPGAWTFKLGQHSGSVGGVRYDGDQGWHANTVAAGAGYMKLFLGLFGE